VFIALRIDSEMLCAGWSCAVLPAADGSPSSARCSWWN